MPSDPPRPAELDTATWVTYLDGSPASLSIRRFRLEAIDGPDAGLLREFDTAVARVGARPGCDLVLNDPKISGVHLEVALGECGYRLRDLGSKNGTWICGLRVIDAYVGPGAIIHLGDTRLRFEPLGEAVQHPLHPSDRFAGMVGQSIAMRQVFARIQRLADSDATVLVTGPTGTGKELVAEALHEYSPRSRGPFVVLDAGSISPNLMESEIFGHERGAFTGADSARAGVFERANGGTIFIDEIGELPLSLQPKLLRVLEKREIRRLGGSEAIPVDFRVVAATHRDLVGAVTRGHFREDLYFRLAVATVRIPPLCERKEDIPLLVEHFTVEHPKRRKSSLPPGMLNLLMEHDWPGNVRELRNVVERAMLLEEIDFQSPPSVAYHPAADPLQAAAPHPGSSPDVLDFCVDVSIPFKDAKHALLEEFEGKYVPKLLSLHGGNVSAAARASGLDRMSLHKILGRIARSQTRR